MANAEHIGILDRGVEYWNRWRSWHPDVEPDLSGADLAGRELRQVNFGNVPNPSPAGTQVHLPGRWQAASGALHENESIGPLSSNEEPLLDLPPFRIANAP